jgi:hypothetical protein
MAVRTVEWLPALYEGDETAWLEAMADLAGDGRAEELDLPHLAEYLSDMARRDRREVESRLVVLLSHLLKWIHEPTHRSRSRRATVVKLRQELNRLAGRGVLRNHAEAILAEVYLEAAERTAAETGLAPQSFPAGCPYTLDQLLTIELSEKDA